MAKFNLDYYSGENFYSDGDIEKEILKIVKTQGSYESMENVPFPVLYHLSRVRENILNWYPFQEDATCLEIGSGCGAISGLLCERMKKVVSVELSKQRADINMARHERVPNLEIWAGNLNDMVFGEQFDYIVLNGVFILRVHRKIIPTAILTALPGIRTIIPCGHSPKESGNV